MQRSNSQREEEIFFDASESSERSSIDSPVYEESIDFITPKPKSVDFISEFSTMDLTSIQERRTKFFKGVGLDEFVQSELRKDEILDFGGIISDMRDTVSDSPSCSGKINGEICLENKGVLSVIKDSINEIGSDRLKSFQDFEALIGLSGLVKRFLRNDLFVKSKKYRGPIRKFKKFWRFLSKRKLRAIDISEYDYPQIKKPIGVDVSKNNKKCLEFSSIYMDQEIMAHKGPIRVMKFSPDGLYLATGGEDSVLRVWKIQEIESQVGFCNYGKLRGVLGIIEVEKLNGSGLAVVPSKVFNILETPFHQFDGHESDILDLTWSKSHYLLTSSMDKTVRLWKVGSERCLAIFQHSTYVTSVQFNPINDGIFMSGSIDGKVRFWRISENRVFDWVDSRHIITSISFQHDAKGFAVGCFNGTCRFYELHDENIVFSHDLKFPSKKKSSAKRITSLQYIQHGKENLLMITAGSKIHITDGKNTVKKYKGIRRSKSHSLPSFTSDGRHVISVSDQSHVHIFNSVNFTNPPSNKNPKPNRSCETFLSPNATIAVPFPGFDLVKPGQVKGIHDPLSDVPDPVPNCLGFGSCFFRVGSPAVTWPEEKLSLKNVKDLILLEKLGKGCGAWNTVVVTAGTDGVIRSFHNYGFPVRL